MASPDSGITAVLPFSPKRYYAFTMKPFSKASQALDDVSAASAQVIETTEWATVALVCVAAVSVVALLAACVALGKVTDA